MHMGSWRTLFMGPWLAVWLGALLSLGGCAGPTSLTSEVSSFGHWPDGRKPGAYVFERLPSQQDQAAQQSLLEAAAQPALASAGFALVADAQQAEFSVQLGASVQVERRPDPFLWPYRPHYWQQGPYRHPYQAPMLPKPSWRPMAYTPQQVSQAQIGIGVGGGWHGGGVTFGMMTGPSYVHMQVNLLIRDRRSNQVLYETHARHERVGAPDERLYPYLFEAALKDFPQQAVRPRAVTVTIPQDNR